MATSRPLNMRVAVLLIMVLSVCGSEFSRKKRKTLEEIKKINGNGPYVGLITVYAPEETAFFATGAFQSDPKHPFVDLAGRRFRVGKIHNKKVIYVRCGVGLVNAAAATQNMVDMFEISGIVHFGIAGNANSSMSIGDVTIPTQFADTGLWDWLNPNGTVDPSDFGKLDIGNFNVPRGEGQNLLGHVGYSTEQFYSESGDPNTPQRVIWVNTTRQWLNLAANLEGIRLERCVNSSFCLSEQPKLVIGLRGATANTFIDNAAYRDFLFQTFHVSSLDMESSAIVMTSLSNSFPVLVIRGLSDLAGEQKGDNHIQIFGPLAASNTARVVIEFLKTLPNPHYALL
ncbi:bark storage protein A [Arachis duranensis]|uniref:Bark storage protein A n=1 Tax=Arachis duranensis TaxID=130453 RepID=A0A6P4C6J9_ARADU|nr:bark storage protein A [Arachis duranensis]